MNRTGALLLAVCLLAAACGGGADAGASSDGDASAEDDRAVTAALEVLETAGEVDLAGGQTQPADEVDAVAAGDTVATDQTGLLELTYVDGSLSRVGPETRFTVRELAGDPDGADVATRLDVGRTWHHVAEVSASDDRFTVETSVATAAVRGTVFSVVCPDQDTCTFAVVEGRVAILIDGEVVAELTAGQQLTVRRGTEPDEQDVVDLTVADLEDDPWFAENLERDGLEPEDIAGGGAAAQEGVGRPRVPLRVDYDYVDAEGGAYDVTVAWDEQTIAMTIDGTTRIINEPGRLVLCDQDDGQCYAIPEGSSFPGAGQMRDAFTVFAGDLPPFEPTGSQDILGRPATCGIATDPETGEQADVCIDDETGALLTADTPEGATYDATAVSEVSPADLEPFGPIEQLPGG